ncbi:hypothetical protein EV194_10426 [Natronoflexus pectinivorans]|uniref:Uncharacterized protein n=1 Tax=Natronoflexus pectinivorans TaxID=682526 RepID=A0A4R2GJT2_9BACT|nr:hypothetical protein EV194_10426 [Natronoflexus pectinivorans]
MKKPLSAIHILMRDFYVLKGHNFNNREVKTHGTSRNTLQPRMGLNFLRVMQ